VFEDYGKDGDIEPQRCLICEEGTILEKSTRLLPSDAPDSRIDPRGHGTPKKQEAKGLTTYALPPNPSPPRRVTLTQADRIRKIICQTTPFCYHLLINDCNNLQN